MLYYWTSDSHLEDELLQLIKKRQLDQKFLYMWKGSDNYYSAYGSEESKDLADESNLHYSKLSYYKFLEKNIFDIEKGKGVLISLGCGSGFQEKGMLKNIFLKGYDLDYLGNDCSRTMLNKAQKNLNDVQLNKAFIYGDFTSSTFANEIESLTEGYDYRIFAFMGCTFGNPNQTSITDTLYNMLGDRDYLLLDLASRESNDQNAKIKLFERYTKYLNDQSMNEFWFTPLKKVGIPMENGKMILRTGTEDSIGAFSFKFFFQFTDKTVVQYKNEKIHCLPGEEIKLLTIRNYDPCKVESFFTDHDYKTIDIDTSDFNGGLSVTQFLFKRK